MSSSSSPYGGDRGGGRKSEKKRGGQPGNVNRRASKILPKQNADERRKFLDALAEAETMPTGEKTEFLLNLAFARVVSLSETVGLNAVLNSLYAFDANRRTEAKLRGQDEARKREAVKDAALADIWRVVCECENCAENVDRILTGAELSLKQLGDSTDAKECMDR